MNCNLTIKILDLQTNFIDDNGLEVLTTVTWEKLEHLNLGHNKIKFIKWKTSNIAQLKHLRLFSNEII